MLIDAAKGIEDRTRKLFEVCKMRQLPGIMYHRNMHRICDRFILTATCIIWLYSVFFCE